MPAMGEVYKCEICGNVVYVLEGGGAELMCCGEEMKAQSGADAQAYMDKLPKS